MYTLLESDFLLRPTSCQKEEMCATYNFQNCSRFLKTIEYLNTVRLIQGVEKVLKSCVSVIFSLVIFIVLTGLDYGEFGVTSTLTNACHHQSACEILLIEIA